MGVAKAQCHYYTDYVLFFSAVVLRGNVNNRSMICAPIPCIV